MNSTRREIRPHFYSTQGFLQDQWAQRDKGFCKKFPRNTATTTTATGQTHAAGCNAANFGTSTQPRHLLSCGQQRRGGWRVPCKEEQESWNVWIQ